MLRKLIMPAALTALSLLTADVAAAHPVLRSADPAPNGVAKAPTEIRMTFSEALIPRFSGIEIVDQRGRAVTRANALTNAANKRQLVAPLRLRLAPGTYRLNWHAVSVDTHRVQGTYVFRISA